MGFLPNLPRMPGRVVAGLPGARVGTYYDKKESVRIAGFAL